MEKQENENQVYLTVGWGRFIVVERFATRTTRDVAMALVNVLKELTECAEYDFSYSIAESISPELEENAKTHTPEQLLSHFVYSMEYPGAEGTLLQMERGGVVECSMFADWSTANALEDFFRSCCDEMGKRDDIHVRLTRPKFENLAYIPRLGSWPWALQLMTQRIDELRNNKEIADDADVHFRFVYGGEQGYICNMKHREALDLKALVDGVVDAWKKGIQSQILYNSKTWMVKHAHWMHPLRIVRKLAQMFCFNAPERTVLLKFKRGENQMEEAFTLCGCGLAEKICAVLQPYAAKCGYLLEYEETLKTDKNRTFEKFRRMDDFMEFVSFEIENEMDRRKYEQDEME